MQQNSLFFSALKENKSEALGFPVHEYQTYTMSKVGLTAATIVQQRNFNNDTDRPDIVVNACCPGK